MEVLGLAIKDNIKCDIKLYGVKTSLDLPESKYGSVLGFRRYGNKILVPKITVDFRLSEPLLFISRSISLHVDYSDG